VIDNGRLLRNFVQIIRFGGGGPQVPGVATQTSGAPVVGPTERRSLVYRPPWATILPWPILSRWCTLNRGFPQEAMFVI
jgi:hypothetical protein